MHFDIKSIQRFHSNYLIFRKVQCAQRDWIYKNQTMATAVKERIIASPDSLVKYDNPISIKTHQDKVVKTCL